MGAYGSWATFAVAHHYLVYYCARKVGVPWSELKYALLGDDLVICHKDVGEKYLEVIKTLGVDCSPLKTHKSDRLCEFAKRWIIDGKEFSPFPVSALREVSKRYYLLVNLFIELEAKGWCSLAGIPSLVSSFYEFVIPKNAKYRAFAEDQSRYSELIMRVMRGAITAGEAINGLVRHYGRNIPPMPEKVCESILSNVSVECFAESTSWYSPNSRSGHPLGDLATELVCLLTGEEGELAEPCLSAIYALPHLACYGQIEETYMKISKEAAKYEDWPMFLRTMALPLDDRIFTQRTKHLVSRASAIIGKHLESRFTQLEMYPQLLNF